MPLPWCSPLLFITSGISSLKATGTPPHQASRVRAERLAYQQEE
jgi:hypothetical protein